MRCAIHCGILILFAECQQHVVSAQLSSSEKCLERCTEFLSSNFSSIWLVCQVRAVKYSKSRCNTSLIRRCSLHHPQWISPIET